MWYEKGQDSKVHSEVCMLDKHSSQHQKIFIVIILSKCSYKLGYENDLLTCLDYESDKTASLDFWTWLPSISACEAKALNHSATAAIVRNIWQFYYISYIIKQLVWKGFKSDSFLKFLKMYAFRNSFWCQKVVSLFKAYKINSITL